MARSLLLAAVVGLLSLMLPSMAWGCKCAGALDAPPEGSPESIAAGLAGNGSVFIGRVTRMPLRALLYLQAAEYWWKTRGGRELSDEEEEKMFLRRIGFEVEVSFKGVTGPRTTVVTGWGGGDCGYPFRRGERYLVYGRELGGWRFTGICHRTKPFSKAEHEVEILKSLVAGIKAP
jgi:hypothetical protein